MAAPTPEQQMYLDRLGSNPILKQQYMQLMGITSGPGNPAPVMQGNWQTSIVDRPDNFWQLSSDDQLKPENQFAYSEGRRRQLKKNQLALIKGMRGPSMAPEMEARLRALQEESAAGPLIGDPYFQKERSDLVRGGANALSSVQQAQKNYGIGGGFSNVGSVNDIYDRLSGQLSALGQRSAELKARKADTVAQARQAFVDARAAYDNSIAQYKMALENQDFAAASMALQQAMSAKAEADKASKSFLGSILGGVLTGGATVAGALLGGPVGAAAGAGLGSQVGGGMGGSQAIYSNPLAAGSMEQSYMSGLQGNPFTDPFASRSMPWSSMK